MKSRQDASATTVKSDLSRLQAGRHSRGYLPHRKAEGRSYFVTFRVAGTLPKEKLLQLKAEHETLTKEARLDNRELDSDERAQLQRWHAERVDSMLDSSTTNCWLRESSVADIVQAALRHFNERRYHLRAWVIMPNHVHVVLLPTPNNTLSSILHSWKSYTALKANQLLQRQGPFWQRESYDHLIRDDEDLYHCIRYVHQNPVSAGLSRTAEGYRWSSAHVPQP